jgi:hypothetical protein
MTHRRQAEILAEIGRTASFGEVVAGDRFARWLRRTPRHRQTVEVRLPQSLARAAVAAWNQEDEVMPESETPEQREARTRAWTLALLGSIVNERGRTEGSAVVVPLRGDVLDAALAAADDPLG